MIAAIVRGRGGGRGGEALPKDAFFVVLDVVEEEVVVVWVDGVVVFGRLPRVEADRVEATQATGFARESGQEDVLQVEEGQPQSFPVETLGGLPARDKRDFTITLEAGSMRPQLCASLVTTC